MGLRGILFAWVMVCGVLRAELPDGLYAHFDTGMGSFTCRLDYAEAPLTCANFAGLIKGSQCWIDPESGAVRNDPFYDGLIFHRVIDGFMIQGGCPLGTGGSGPGYTFPDERVPSMNDYQQAGTLVMANSGPDSNGSQFFISVVPYPNLDPSKYMVFGDVVDGLGVVTNIGSVATTGPAGDPKDKPLVDVVINQIRILRIGAEAQAFDVAAQPLPKVMPLNLKLSDSAAGLQLAASITNQMRLSLSSSTNLFSWSSFSDSYWPTTDGEELVSVGSDAPASYFRGGCVFYPQAVTAFSDIEGHTLTFTQGTDVFVFSPVAGGVGTCNIAGTAAALTYWEEWTSEPYVGRVVFQPAGIYAFQFILSRGGECKGYQYNGFGWNYIGIWIRGEHEVIPE